MLNGRSKNLDWSTMGMWNWELLLLSVFEHQGFTFSAPFPIHRQPPPPRGEPSRTLTCTQKVKKVGGMRSEKKGQMEIPLLSPVNLPPSQKKKKIVDSSSFV